MQRARAAINTGGLDLREDVGAAFRFNLVGRFAHERVALKARDFRIDRVVDVLDGRPGRSPGLPDQIPLR